MSPFEVGAIWGSGKGGMETFEDQVTKFAKGYSQPHFSPFFFAQKLIRAALAILNFGKKTRISLRQEWPTGNFMTG